MTPRITAFKSSPDGGVGMARDMRVRWALEEVGLPYEVTLVTFEEMKQPDHLARHPFGQIPTFEEDGLVLFESGAIILHIAEGHPGLLPEEPKARARAIAWMFSALSTVEPSIVDREQSWFLERDKSWYGEHMEIVDNRIRSILSRLSDRLGDGPWLDDDFSAGDLMMIMVLRRAEPDIMSEFPTLEAYVQRGTERPAYGRAYSAQHQVFLDSQRG